MTDVAHLIIFRGVTDVHYDYSDKDIGEDEMSEENEEDAVDTTEGGVTGLVQDVLEVSPTVYLYPVQTTTNTVNHKYSRPRIQSIQTGNLTHLRHTLEVSPAVYLYTVQTTENTTNHRYSRPKTRNQTRHISNTGPPINKRLI